MKRKHRAFNLTRIRVVGVGGGGCNAVNHMISKGIYGVDFVAINTDSLALSKSQASTRICIGRETTRYLGTGSNPELGAAAATKALDKFRASVKGADMVFITAGMGGGTGTGAAPIFAQAAQEMGILTVAIVTRPFLFEGSQRILTADGGIKNLKPVVDTLIVIPNDRLLDMVDERTGINDAFQMVNDVLYRNIRGVTEVITVPGDINRDFADIRSVMAKQGAVMIGVGRAAGIKRSQLATEQAIKSPLSGLTVDGAKNILVNITTGRIGANVEEIEMATGIIKEVSHPDVRFFFGTATDIRMRHEMQVTIIATGLDRDDIFDPSFLLPSRFRFEQPPVETPLPMENGNTYETEVGIFSTPGEPELIPSELPIHFDDAVEDPDLPRYSLRNFSLPAYLSSGDPVPLDPQGETG